MHYVEDQWGTYDPDWTMQKGFKTENYWLVYNQYSELTLSDHYPTCTQLSYLPDDKYVIGARL